MRHLANRQTDKQTVRPAERQTDKDADRGANMAGKQAEGSIWANTDDATKRNDKNYNCVLSFVLCHAEELVRFYYQFVTCVFTADNNSDGNIDSEENNKHSL